ncbi:uncharacterized protein JCM10292_001011 [Rhodotorula paludigena]|uniref:uncharacterized protein n=1 Tax=Rhodotorula paludigena TaxID=86838 RepID=UPI00317DF126
MLPDHLELASLLNSPSSRDEVLAALLAPTVNAEPTGARARALAALKPYLSLETLLALRGLAAFDEEEEEPGLSDVLDVQREWVAGAGGEGRGECPAAQRDEYLVRLVKGASNGQGVVDQLRDALGALRDQLDRGEGVVLHGPATTTQKHEIRCASAGAFEDRLSEASAGVLDNLDWSNVLLGGGSVLSILTGKQDDEAYNDSDLDLFLIGLKPEELVPKVNAIIEQIKSTLPPPPKKTGTEWSTGKHKEIEVDSDDEEWLHDHYFDWHAQHEGELLVLKGFNAFTLVPPLVDGSTRRRTIQIICQSFETRFDALAGFDLDCCAVGWDGKEVVAVPRAVRALALGANLFDPKLARKGDPSSAIVSSRALKYLSRGFSLALPPVALSILSSAGIDFRAVLVAGRARAADPLERKKVKTEDLAGVCGTLRREYNALHSAEDERVKAPIGADYGPANASWMKLVGERELRVWPNERRDRARVVGVAGQDARDISHKAKSGASAYFGGLLASYVVPYVASFDNEFVLDLKPAKKDPFELTWRKIQNIQYIVKLPRSALELIEMAEDKLKTITDEAHKGGSIASAAKKAKTEDVQSMPAFSDEDAAAIHAALKVIHKAQRVPHEVNKGWEGTGIDPVVPNSFPGPYAPPVRRASLFFGASSSSSAARTSISSTVKPSLVSPVLGYGGAEVAQPKKKSDCVYRVVTLAGLWQFRGLDADIDQALAVIWQCWVATARAAVSLPSEMSDADALSDLLGPEEFSRVEAAYLAQPTVDQVLDKLAADLARLEEMARSAAESTQRMCKAGEWDGERKRFLLQWVRDQQMI